MSEELKCPGPTTKVFIVRKLSAVLTRRRFGSIFMSASVLWQVFQIFYRFHAASSESVVRELAEH